MKAKSSDNPQSSQSKENRYARQIQLPEIGIEGQQKLARSAVLLIGCGALGTMVSQALVRAGVGTLRIADRDTVEMSNLQRQVLFTEKDALNGTSKAKAAQKQLGLINSQVAVEGLTINVDASQMDTLLNGITLVVDGTDNLHTRYIINDACVARNVPWIYGGTVKTGGVVLPIVPGDSPCLRCLFPSSTNTEDLPTAKTAGIIGPAPMITGAMEATEAIKIIVGNLSGAGRIVQFDLWTGTHSKIQMKRNPNCPVCQPKGTVQ